MSEFSASHDEAAPIGRRVVLGSALAAIGALTFDSAPAHPLGGVVASGVPAAGAPAKARAKPLALVYRGPAAEIGAGAAAVRAIQQRGALNVAYVGPGQARKLTPASLRAATLYVQPGGGSVEAAWPRMAPYRRTIVNWVRGGGHYLGLCLGGYLAANDPGFGLWPGRIVDYKSIRGADIARSAERLARIRWRRRSTLMYVEDPPVFFIPRGARGVTVLGRYRTGHIAAASVRVGRGRVTVVGPHPEAPSSWARSFGASAKPDLGAWADLERTALL